MNKISDISKEDIIRMYQFGSSVEGKDHPNDIDIFVIVKNGRYQFKKDNGLHTPIVFDEGQYHYFVMPEDDGEDLLNAMLYTGRKDPDRQHRGLKAQLI